MLFWIAIFCSLIGMIFAIMEITMGIFKDNIDFIRGQVILWMFVSLLLIIHIAG